MSSELEFEAAMRDFVQMFPAIDRNRIERVLRKNDGNVAETIDELLTLAAVRERSIENPSSQSSTQRPSTTRSVTETLKEGKKTRVLIPTSSSSSSSPSSSTDPSCLDDERLALLLQNEEFMKFVKHDRRLVDELEGGRGRSQSALESTSPLMEPVPDGCSSTSSSIRKRLSGKVMNRLRKSSDSTIPSFDHHLHTNGQDQEEEQCVGYDPFPYTKTVGYRSENGHLTDRLRHMSRASKERLTELARSFSSRRNDRSLYYPSSMS